MTPNDLAQERAPVKYEVEVAGTPACPSRVFLSVWFPDVNCLGAQAGSTHFSLCAEAAMDLSKLLLAAGMMCQLVEKSVASGMEREDAMIFARRVHQKAIEAHACDELIENLLFDGYEPGLPTWGDPRDVDYGFHLDKKACAKSKCRVCGHSGLDALPFRDPTLRRYTVVAVCPICKHADEI